MKLALPIHSQSTSPLREGIVYTGLTIALTWLFWVPGAFLPSGSLIGDVLLAIGSFAPLAVVIFLDIWLQRVSIQPLAWLRTLNLRNVIVALLLPPMLLMPLFLLRMYQGTLDVGNLLATASDLWQTLVGLFLLALAEEIGWRAYLLPRLKLLPLPLANFLIGIVWFGWQLPLVIAGRYNESEDFGTFFIAMFLFSILFTPFLNRLAMRAGYNPILPAVARAGTSFVIAVYALQGRADPLTDTYGTLAIAWLVVLNLVLFSQLWQGKKPPAQITELERVMPLETG